MIKAECNTKEAWCKGFCYPGKTEVVRVIYIIAALEALLLAALIVLVSKQNDKTK